MAIITTTARPRATLGTAACDRVPTVLVGSGPERVAARARGESPTPMTDTRAADARAPHFLSVPVGQAVSPADLAAEMASVHTCGVHGWQVVMDVRDSFGEEPSWLIGLRHDSGRRERRIFRLLEQDQGPVWCRRE